MSEQPRAEPPRPQLVALEIADPPEVWRALGFEVEDASLPVGGITLRLGAAGEGITSWALSGLPREGDVAGLATKPPPLRSATTPPHPNGAVGVDQVVVLTPDFEATTAALAAAGLPLRRIRDAGGVRQGFRRLGPAILELVEAKDAGGPSARFWGLVVIVNDLDALAARLEDRLGAPRPAVQPGRRIATLRDTAGSSTQVAFMDPDPA
ncbi:MAG: VOC family protein [Solirubrobacteraceae bacterium]